jgi:CRP/FNR family transcriptional regulator
MVKHPIFVVMIEVLNLVNQSFPQFYESELREEISKVGFIKDVDEGEHIMDVGQYVKTIPLVVHGKLKIYREDEGGNELFLYYLNSSEACAISLVCTLHNQISQVRAVAIEPTQIIAIPIEYMDQFMMKYRSWYQFVVKTYGERLNEMLRTIDSIAFKKMDERLIAYLENTANAIESDVIKDTHQNIAIELNTSREVVSRLLKQMERKGLVELSRNAINLIRK